MNYEPFNEVNAQNWKYAMRGIVIIGIVLLVLLGLAVRADAAIAVDAVSEGEGGTSSLTFSHTTSGSDRVLICGIDEYRGDDDDIITSVTYNGDAMTRADHQPFNSGPWYTVYLYYLVAPDTGANNVVISASPDAQFNILWGNCISYTGVDQSTPLEAIDALSLSSNADLNAALTTVTDQAWQLVIVGADDAANTAGSGTTIRVNNNGTRADYFTLADSGAPLSPGSHSLIINVGNSVSTIGYITVSIKPAGSGGGGGGGTTTVSTTTPNGGGALFLTMLGFWGVGGMELLLIIGIFVVFAVAFQRSLRV